MSKCPCCSNQDFSVCCNPYITGEKTPETPEKLMRSRYTAYATANIDYIQKTMCKKAAENYDPIAAKNWACSTSWVGLTVIDAPAPVAEFAAVAFFARFRHENIKMYMYEKSQFEKINGLWFYVDGVALTINRNEACPCGSGRKFKRCCS